MFVNTYTLPEVQEDQKHFMLETEHHPTFIFRHVDHTFYTYCEEVYKHSHQKVADDPGYFSEEDGCHSKKKDWTQSHFWTRRILPMYHPYAVAFLNEVTQFGRNYGRGMEHNYVAFDGRDYSVLLFRSILSQLMSTDDRRQIPSTDNFYRSLLKKKYKYLQQLVRNKYIMLYYCKKFDQELLFF